MKYAAMAALAALGWAWSTQDAPRGLVVKRADAMARPPDADMGPARAWVVEKSEGMQAMLIEITGAIPMHVHPDGVHRMYVIEGKLRVTIEGAAWEMGPGDYVMIPKGAKHKVEKLGEGRALYASVDMPPVDAKKIEWIEPPPQK